MILKTAYKMKPPLSVRPRQDVLSKLVFVGLWAMNERSGTKVFDLSGNNNTGILQANALWDAGFIVCEANGDKIISPTTGFGQAGTIIFSFNGTGTPNGWGSFVSADVQSDFSILRGNSTTNIYIEINGSGVYLSGNASWGTGKHIIAFTWDASINIRKRYDDGILSDTDTTAFTEPTYGSNFHWGDRADDLRTIGGRFGWIYGYNHALSASEIAQISSVPFCMFERRARLVAVPAAAVTVRGRAGIGFRPIMGADRLRGLRRSALY